MSQTVISVENLNKTYRLGQIGTGTLTNDFKVWWAKKTGNPNPLLKIGQIDHGNLDGETLWALKNVNFTVEKGEVLGIIGRNGAGKSTLLKILSRVTAPTSGYVKVKGRIASLLEVGTGFHPDLTGRENVYLNGAILGMTKEEVTRKFDEIIAFAEIEKFIDTPVKRYSSGMYVRLAFAVAAHLESEILLVDEVLAVGDTEFQKKCLGKMGDVATKEGRTVLFVSHNMAAIENLCPNAICLANGKIEAIGETAIIIDKYQSKLSSKVNKNIDLYRAGWAQYKYIKTIRLLNSKGDECSCFKMGENINIKVTVESPNGDLISSPVLGVVINHQQKGTVGGINSRMKPYNKDLSPSCLYTLSCSLKKPPLLQGCYTLDIWLGNKQADIDAIIGGVEFAIDEADIYSSGKAPFSHMGMIFLDADWDFATINT